MSHEEARRVLDAARAGGNIPESTITLALMQTGDITRLVFDEIWTAARRPVWARHEEDTLYV